MLLTASHFANNTPFTTRCLFTRYSQLSKWFDNRLYTRYSQLSTDLTILLTTGWIVYTKIQPIVNPFDNRFNNRLCPGNGA